MMLILLQILVAWLCADLITGFVHWFEDAYLSGDYTTAWVQSIADENHLHHQRPTAMIVNSGWTNMRSSAFVAWPVAVLLWSVGGPPWVWLAVFFAGFGNLIHRWSHVPARQLPRWIRGMQEFGLFISHEHHDSHHRSMQELIPKHLARWKFCPMTDWVNPYIDQINLWRNLERLLAQFGWKTTRQRMAQTEDSGT